MRYLALLLLVGCATIPHRTVEDSIRDEIITCAATADNIHVLDGCFDRARNRCLNADMEPDCYEK